VRVPAYATAGWRKASAIAVLVAFALVLVVVGISMHEIARVVPEGMSQDGNSQQQPSDFVLYVGCIGTGLVLASVAAGVVVAFFEEFGSMEPRASSR